MPRSAQRKSAETGKSAAAALAIPATTVRQALSCDKAKAIVADFGFKDIRAETCEGTTRDFSATRDGKKFDVKILAANGELTKVKRLE